MHYIYKITNKLNNKTYIGQTIDPVGRWQAHKSYAMKSDKIKQYVHHAMAKYGLDNFIFEIIDIGLNHWHIDCLEINYINTFDSRDPEKGYNLKTGGSRGAHSEETKRKQSEATFKQIAEKGHPGQGTKRTDEQRARMSAIQQSKDNEAIYTEEVRQKMSEAHIGLKDTEETKNRKSESIKLSWEKRQAELEASRELKCNAPGCDIFGANKAYLIVNNIRYCSMHGQRLNKNGTLEKSEEPWNKGIKLSEEDRKKCGIQNIGRVPVNKIKFTDEQIQMIMADPRSNEVIAKDLGYGKNAIQKLRRSIKLSKSL